MAELAFLESFETWDSRVGAGNGWITDGPDTCVRYISATGEPVMGTRVYPFGWSPGDHVGPPVVTAPGGGQQAVVVAGPARIRSGPGLEYARLLWCNEGWPLTVWPPAVGGWLRASCFGADGWIHESLVRSDNVPVLPAPVAPAVSQPAGGQPAVVAAGPARIRNGPGVEFSRLLWCVQGTPLTVWPPALNGWLRASCHGTTGWIHESLVGIGDAPVQPAPAAPVVGDPSGSGQPAVVINGPAHIRSGPGSEHPHLRWCGVDWPLTVWSPAQNGWLRASCYGANGWIHESLVAISD